MGAFRFGLGCAAAGAGAAVVFLVGQWCGARGARVDLPAPPVPAAVARAAVTKAVPPTEMTLAEAVARGRRLLAAPRRSPGPETETRRAQAIDDLESPIAETRRVGLLELSRLDPRAAVGVARRRVGDPALLEIAASLLLRPSGGAVAAPADIASVAAALRSAEALPPASRTAVASLLFQSLARAGSPDAATWAAPLLRAPDVRTRYLTTAALLSLPPAAAKPLLEQALHDRDPAVQRRARESLEWLARTRHEHKS